MTKHSRLLPLLALLTLAISLSFFHAKPALPAERPGEQVMLLPDGDHLLLNFNVPAFFKSKTFAELHARSAQASELLGVALEKHVGVSTNNIDLIRLGLTHERNGNPRPMTVVIVKKPVTLDHIKANVGARTDDWTTVKADGRNVHYITGHDPNPVNGPAPFCIDGKLTRRRWPPCFSVRLRRAASTRIRRMASAAAAKKCPRFSQQAASLGSTRRRYASWTRAVAFRVLPGASSAIRIEASFRNSS